MLPALLTFGGFLPEPSMRPAAPRSWVLIILSDNVRCHPVKLGIEEAGMAEAGPGTRAEGR